MSANIVNLFVGEIQAKLYHETDVLPCINHAFLQDGNMMLADRFVIDAKLQWRHIYLEQERMMQNKRVLMIVGGVLGLAALCCVGVVIFGYFYNDASGSGSSTRSLVALKAVCDGEAAAETAEFNPNNPGVHPAAIVQHLGGNESIFVSTDWGFQPAILEKAELVICLENVEEVVTETCEYTLEEGAGDATITRISLLADYRLMTAQTAELVDEGTVKAVPRECRDEETFTNNASFSLRGDFGEALEPLVGKFVNVP